MANLKVVIGTDDLLVAETVRRAWPEDLSPEVIDSLNSTNAEAQLRDIVDADAAFSTPPFLDPRKVTWWRNVHFLPGGGKKKVAEEVKEALDRLAEKIASMPLPENQEFVISGPALLKTSVLAKRLATVAEMVYIATPSPWEAGRVAAERVAESAAVRGLKFDSDALDAFIAKVGTDTRSLESELDKLDTFLGPEERTVTSEQVALISSPGVGVEPEIWAISDALGARDAETALKVIREFEGQSGFAVLATTVAEKCLRQLYDLKRAEASGELSAALQNLTPFQRRKYKTWLPKWTLGELRVARARFLQLRERAVTTSGGADPLVGLTLLRVILRRGVRR